MKNTLCCLLTGLLGTACASAGRPPMLGAPGKSDIQSFSGGTTFSLGFEIPAFQSTVMVDGEEHTAGGPRHRLWPLDVVAVDFRDAVSDRCDVAAGVRIGALTTGGRCGIGNELWTLAVGTTVTWEWFHGISLFVGGHGAIHDDGWVIGLGSGFTSGWWNSFSNLEPAVWGGDPSLFDTALTGPEEPLVSVSRLQVNWSSSVTVGFPTSSYGNGLVFASPFFDVPVATAFEQYHCVGCSAEVGGFVPNTRIGVMIGIGGTL